MRLDPCCHSSFLTNKEGHVVFMIPTSFLRIHDELQDTAFFGTSVVHSLFGSSSPKHMLVHHPREDSFRA